MRRPGPPLAAVTLVALAAGAAGLARPAPSPGGAEAPAHLTAARWAPPGPAGSVVVATPSVDVVLARQPDGRWLVTAESPGPPTGEH